jgi:hypothetical protein
VKGAPQLERNVLKPVVVSTIANEIVRRYLVALPKSENLIELKQFLLDYLPTDGLLQHIDEILDCIQNPANWFDEEQIFLSKLRELSSIDTIFKPAITKVLLAFQLQQPHDVYYTNIIVTIQKKAYSTGKPEDDFLVKQFIENNITDGMIRRICTYKTEADGAIFPDEANIKSDFEIAARRTQEHLRVTRKIPGDSKLMQYAFMDELAYHSELKHEGSSAGLAFAWLAYSCHNMMDNRLTPYIAFCGSLKGNDTIEAVSNIKTKVKIAKENGIRVIVLPESNMSELSPDNDIQFITYPEGKLDDVIGSIANIITEMHIRNLGPKEAIYWDELIEKSRKQSDPILGRAKENVKYSPEKYVSRNKIEADFKSFIDDPDRNCMIIAGESGSGKTYFLCNLCDRSINDGNIVLFWTGLPLIPTRPLWKALAD